jgi:DNA-binding MarR family transcriptional regulator
VSHGGPSIREVSMALRQLVLGWERFRERVAAELDVGTTEVVALTHLYLDGPLTPRDLGHLLTLTSGSVTALLDRLEGSGFVSRAHNPDDRRSLLASLTPAGKHAILYYYERLDGIVARELHHVPELPPHALIEMATALGAALTAHAQESAEG